ncbi:hypothetical protein [Candidatus Binatus sp.]|uniref:hypothetical protein n=1 Tax=Candidatus Binatus sp. TaxID=2811406 RepID=UPI002B48B1DB|nr:hypothetical protein [Candidatus Binatus sp.]
MTRPRFFQYWLLAIVATLTACSSPLPSTELPPARYIEVAPEFPGFHDYRGIVDLPIKASGMDQPGIADLAKTAQIDFIFLADRVGPGDTDFGIAGFTNDILFVSGGAFDVGGSQIVGANLHEPIKPNLASNDLIAAIHDQGGLAIASDPAKFASSEDYALADAMEVYNDRSAWLAQSPTTLYFRAIFSGTDHFLAGLDVRPDANLALYDRMTTGARISMLAGIGAPDNLNVLGAKVGTIPQLFLFCTTHLLARERNTAPLLEALRLGHSYVSFDYLGYVGAFAFFAHVGDTMAMMGDEIHLAPGLTLRTELPAPADIIAMYQNGAEVASAENASTLEFTPKSPGAYRIEAYRSGKLWILSNPIYVR